MLTKLINLISALIVAFLPRKVWMVTYHPGVESGKPSCGRPILMGIFSNRKEALAFGRYYAREVDFSGRRSHGWANCKVGFVRRDETSREDFADTWIIHNLDQNLQGTYLAMTIKDWDWVVEHFSIQCVSSDHVIEHFQVGVHHYGDYVPDYPKRW